MTDSTHRDSGITTSSEVLAHYAKTALMYEELRAAIDDGHESMTHADALAEIAAIRAENAALQQGYDAARLEIEHLRGATKSKLLAQPVAWMVYLPSIDTQHLYYSQEDMGYVDDVTNHADAEVTPLYEMAAPKAEVAPSGEYPPLPTGSAWCGDDDVRDFGAGAGESALMFEPTQTQHVPLFTAGQMRTYADATCAMRAQAAHAAAAWPVPADEDDHKRIRILRRGLNKSTVLAALLRHGTDAARAQAKQGDQHG